MIDTLEEINFKVIIADECHYLKNANAARTNLKKRNLTMMMNEEIYHHLSNIIRKRKIHRMHQ